MPADQPLSAETLGDMQRSMRVLILGTERYRRIVADELGLNVAGVVALGHLFHYGPMTPRVIADWLGFSTGATTAVLDRAAELGFLARKPNPADRRSVLVSLTARGQRAISRAFEQTNAVLFDALSVHPESELVRLAEVMRTVGESLQAAVANSVSKQSSTSRRLK